MYVSVYLYLILNQIIFDLDIYMLLHFDVM